MRMESRRQVDIEGATLYLGDCREILPTLRRVFAVVTDPPYGIGYTSRRRAGGRALTVANDEKAPLWCVPLMTRLIAPGGALYLATRFDVSAAWVRAIHGTGLRVRTPIFWDKCNWTAGDCYGDFGAQVEIFLFAHGGHHRLRAGRPANLWKLPRPVWSHWESGNHPTPKPVGLIMRMIECSTDPGDIVLDPFMGSGATAVAALRMGRRFIGCELMPSYFEFVCERLRHHARQGDFMRSPLPRRPSYADQPPLPLAPEPVPPMAVPIPSWREYRWPGQWPLISERPARTIPLLPRGAYRPPTQLRLL